jgi:protocatechuate 3,4-dioxygenase alpha subunit
VTPEPAAVTTAAADAGAPQARPAVAPTPSQTVGPFLSMGMQPMERNDVVPVGSPGAFELAGSVLDGAGAPVPDAVVELWQAAPDGTFSSTAGRDGDETWFGRSLTDAEGRFGFVTVKPGRIGLDDGRLQAPHLELLVFARGLLRPVRTRAYFPDEPAANASDPVLNGVPEERRHTLVATAAGNGTLRFDVRLQGADETVFFAC